MPGRTAKIFRYDPEQEVEDQSIRTLGKVLATMYGTLLVSSVVIFVFDGKASLRSTYFATVFVCSAFVTLLGILIAWRGPDFIAFVWMPMMRTTGFATAATVVSVGVFVLLIVLLGNCGKCVGWILLFELIVVMVLLGVFFIGILIEQRRWGPPPVDGGEPIQTTHSAALVVDDDPTGVLFKTDISRPEGDFQNSERGDFHTNANTLN